MSASIVRIIALILTVACCSTVQAQAQDDDALIDKVTEKQNRDNPKAVGLDGSMYRRIEAINDLIDASELQQALEETESLYRRRLKGYEEAVVLQILGFIHGQLGNTDPAIEYVEKALATRELPAPAHQALLYSLAYLYAEKKDFEAAVELMTEWFVYEDKPHAEAYMFMGSCLAALTRFDDALPFIEQANAVSARPIESWYQMAVSIYLELQEYEKAIPALKQMLTHWTQMPMYWEMLAGVYLELGRDKDALDTTMTAYINGMVTDPGRILGLVEMTLIHDVPYTAGAILENEMIAGVVPENKQNLDLLIDTWIVAREYDRAISAISKALKYTDAGSYHMRAARLYVQAGNWQGAATSAGKALEEGVSKPVEALLLIGTASSELQEFEAALSAFRKVREIGSTTERDNAATWIAFVEEARDYQRQVLATN